MVKKTDYKTAFFLAFAGQTGIDKPTLKDIHTLETDIQPDQLRLLDESDRFWIIMWQDDDVGGTGREVLSVVYKKYIHDMDSLEIGNVDISIAKSMDFERAFQTAYLLQQNIKRPTKADIEDYGVDPGELRLLEETDRYWIIKTEDDGRTGEDVNVVYKDTLEMDTLPIR